MVNDRWVIKYHCVEDKFNGKIYQDRDRFIVDAFNILFREIKELQIIMEDEKIDGWCSKGE